MALFRSGSSLQELGVRGLIAFRHCCHLSEATNSMDDEGDDEKVGFIRRPASAKTRAEMEEERKTNWFYLQRSPLWKGRDGSKEALLVVRELRRAKGDPWKLHVLVRTKVARLLKLDLIATLNELQHLEEVDLALMIFVVIRRELWYRPEVYLYRSMLNCLGRHKRVAQARVLLDDWKRQGIKPSASLCSELMVEYLKLRMVSEALEVFEEIKAVDACDKLIYRILLKELLQLGRRDLWSKYKKDYFDAFGEEVYNEFFHLSEVDKSF